jgi:hypothetical protein
MFQGTTQDQDNELIVYYNADAREHEYEEILYVILS